jgi:hypothetical protein
MSEYDEDDNNNNKDDEVGEIGGIHSRDEE